MHMWQLVKMWPTLTYLLHNFIHNQLSQHKQMPQSQDAVDFMYKSPQKSKPKFSQYLLDLRIWPPNIDYHAISHANITGTLWKCRHHHHRLEENVSVLAQKQACSRTSACELKNLLKACPLCGAVLSPVSCWSSMGPEAIFLNRSVWFKSNLLMT